MADFIDRKQLFEDLNNFAPEHYSALVNEIITLQPTTDVVEVVRCKDCIYSFGRAAEDLMFCSASLDTAVRTHPGGFCSKGERKGGGRNERY